MKQIKDMLIAHLNEHSLDFGSYDADTVLDFLCTAYREAHETNQPNIRSLFAQLSDHLESLPLEKNNAMFSIIVQLCTEHERLAFTEGIRWGFQLHTELTQPEVL